MRKMEYILEIEKSLVFFSGQYYALLKPDNLGTRIIGKGVIQ
jgi:hypothetical protein